MVAALGTLARELKPEATIVSGDVTQRARRHQFEAAKAFCDSLGPSPLLALPGNHDIPLFNLAARAFRPLANYRSSFGPDLDFDYSGAAFRVIGINTSRWWRHVQGEVSHRQVESVAEQLQASETNQVRLVVTHHPVQVAEARDRHNLVRGHAYAARTWVAAGADLLLGGHIHRPQVRLLNHGFTEPFRRAWSVLAGTATSRRTRDNIPNSVNVLRAVGQPPTLCVVERWDFYGAGSRFERVSCDRLPLDRPD